MASSSESSSTLDSLPIRERVLRYYQAYAPENISKVDNALERYKGQEKQLIEDLKLKYGKPEPPLDGTSPAASRSDAAENSPKPPPPSSRSLPPLASPRKGSVRRNSSVSTPTNSNASPTAAAVVTAFGEAEVSDGDDDDDAYGYASGDGQSYDGGHSVISPAAAAAEEDPFAKLRQRVTQDVGFTDPALKRIWEDAWLGKIPLQNVQREWGETAIHSGLGWKLTNSSKVQRWQRRFFFLVPNFLYYFDSDEPSTPCKGAVYLDRAKVKEVDVKDRKAIVITPRVFKKPLELVAEGDYSNFTINFDPKRAQTVWYDLIVKVSQMGPSSSKNTGPTTLGSGATALRRQQSSVSSSSPLRRAQSAVASPNRSPALAEAAASARYDQQSMQMLRATQALILQQQQQQTALSGGMGGAAGGSSTSSVNGAAADDLVVISQRGAPEQGPHNNVNVIGSTGGVSSNLGFSSAVALASSTAQPMMAMDNNNNNNNYGYVATTASSPSPSRQIAEENRRLLAQQQQLQEMLLAAQQQQSELAYRAQLQQDAVKARQTLQVDDSDLKRRITKVAAEKDTSQLADTLLQFVVDNVTDLNALWKLMSALDDLPRKPSLLVQPSSSGSGGGGGGGGVALFSMGPMSGGSDHAAQQIQSLQAQQLELQLKQQRLLVQQQQQQQQHYHADVSSITNLDGTPSPAARNIMMAAADDAHHLEPSPISVPSPSTASHSFMDVSQQLAQAQAQRRQEELDLQRQRIQDNYSLAQRYNASSSSPSPTPAPAGGGSHRLSPPPSTLQPIPSIHAAHSLGAPPSSAEDHLWQERMQRMKQRKRVVEGILNDLPM